MPAVFKKRVAKRMRDNDIKEKKKKSSTSALWRNFDIPQIEHYQVLLT